MNTEIGFDDNHILYAFERDDMLFIELYDDTYSRATYCVDRNVVDVSYGQVNTTIVKSFIRLIRDIYLLDKPCIIDGDWKEWKNAIA